MKEEDETRERWDRRRSKFRRDRLKCEKKKGAFKMNSIRTDTINKM